MSSSHQHEHAHHTPIDWDRPLSRRDVFRYGAGVGFGVIGAGMLASCVPIVGVTTNGAWDNVPPADGKYVVIIVIDGCRADYLSYGHLPNLDTLISNGTTYQNAWCGMMESITPACHASLGTGSFPQHDGGIVGFWWENPSNHHDFNAANTANNFPSGATNPATLETIIKRSGSPTLAGLLKQADPTAKVYAASGPKFYAADAAGGPDSDYTAYFWVDANNGYRPLSISPHDLPADILNDPAFYYGPNNPGPAIANGMSPDSSGGWYSMINDHLGLQDAMVIDLTKKVTEQERPRVVMLNLPEMDYPVLHLDGGPLSPNKVTHVMENADRKIGQLMDHYRNLGIYDQTLWVLVGDHGCTPLERLVEYKEVVPRALYNAGTGYAGGFPYLTHDYHTGGFIWVWNPDKAGKAAELLDQSHIPGVAGIYFLSDFGSKGGYLPSPETARSTPPPLDAAYRYLLNTMVGATAPHIVLVYEERTGSDVPTTKNWNGDHGGINWSSQHIPMILSGPGVRKGHKSAFPARLVDVAPTALRILGVDYPGMDGIALADAFVKPTKLEASTQRSRATYLLPAANALRERSILDIREQGKLKPLKGRKNGNSPAPPTINY
ncbi:MAG TPA: alkaline phosphatase family protein [Chloroflexota bacterium]|nr:alkaline phosphatase family protein [Chloroflexota bacterium]